MCPRPEAIIALRVGSLCGEGFAFGRDRGYWLERRALLCPQKKLYRFGASEWRRTVTYALRGRSVYAQELCLTPRP